MTTPKAKPAPAPMIEVKTEELQLATVTVEQKAPARVARVQHADMVAAALPRRGKITLH